MKESDILKLVMIEASKLGCIVWRNNTGVLKDARGIPVKYGLCVGSSDLIGITPNGKFLAIEVKQPTKKLSPKQEIFIKTVRRMGGYAGVAYSPDDVKNIIKDT